jgi:hypothetical protein
MRSVSRSYASCMVLAPLRDCWVPAADVMATQLFRRGGGGSRLLRNRCRCSGWMLQGCALAIAELRCAVVPEAIGSKARSGVSWRRTMRRSCDKEMIDKGGW